MFRVVLKHEVADKNHVVHRPGSGQNVRHFDRKKVSKLYLVEPCLGLHDELKVNLKKAGLEDIATIIRQ